MWVHVFPNKTITKCNEHGFNQWYRFAGGTIEKCCLMIWKRIGTDFFAIIHATADTNYFCHCCCYKFDIVFNASMVCLAFDTSINPKLHDNCNNRNWNARNCFDMNSNTNFGFDNFVNKRRKREKRENRVKISAKYTVSFLCLLCCAVMHLIKYNE